MSHPDGDIVARIAALLRTMPTAATDAQTRADWLEQKAATFDAIAELDPVLANQLAPLADTARAQARQLRGETPT